MSKKKNFTKEQKHLIKQCIIDADIMGLGKHETIAYVKSRLGLDDNSSNNNIDPTFHGYPTMLDKVLLNSIANV